MRPMFKGRSFVKCIATQILVFLWDTPFKYAEWVTNWLTDWLTDWHFLTSFFFTDVQLKRRKETLERPITRTQLAPIYDWKHRIRVATKKKATCKKRTPVLQDHSITPYYIKIFHFNFLQITLWKTLSKDTEEILAVPTK